MKVEMSTNFRSEVKLSGSEKIEVKIKFTFLSLTFSHSSPSSSHNPLTPHHHHPHNIQYIIEIKSQNLKILFHSTKKSSKISTTQNSQKTQIEVISILDMSGSMYDLRDDTIGGYNQYIDTIRKEKSENNEIYVTLIVFNTQVNFVYKRELIKDVKKINQTVYKPNGCTALNDAIGRGIEYIDDILSAQKQIEKNIQVCMYIQTDGMENSSRNYSKSQIKEMITEKKNKGWDVVFAACNIDSFATGQSYGIDSSNIAQIGSDGKAQRAVYKGLGRRFRWAFGKSKDNETRVGGKLFDIQGAYNDAYDNE